MSASFLAVVVRAALALPLECLGWSLLDRDAHRAGRTGDDLGGGLDIVA